MLMLKFIFTMILLSTFLLEHPMSLCFMLILSAMVVGSLTGIICFKWLFYVLVILFLGGMMVLFTYVCSLISSSKIVFKPGSVMYLLGSVFMVMVLMVSDFDYQNKLLIPSFYSTESAGVLLFSAVFLLLVLLIVVKMINKNEGSLKSKINENSL